MLKASTALIAIPPAVWTSISGGILVVFGAILLFPTLWERLPGLGRLTTSSNKLVGAGHQKKSVWGDIVIGAALGPVFATCSPTYFVILATVLPASFLLGTTYLLAYIAGLALVLLAISLLGQSLATRLSWIADGHGWFKRGLGLLFLLVGLAVMTGFDKVIETKILDSGVFDVTQVEQRLLDTLE